MRVPKEEIIERLQKQPSEENLSLLPLFTGRKAPYLKTDMLHKSYHPDVSVSSILFNNRASAVLQVGKIKTIGQLLLTSYTDLLLYRNCGLQTIEVFQNDVRTYILDKKFDYSPYWKDLESMLRNVLNVKERNFLIFFYRLGLNSKEPFTLQKCGEKFGITREAARQTLKQINEIIIHPETEFKLRPFWLAVDKVLKKKDVTLSEDLARKVKEKLSWEVKPEAHSIERMLKIKKDRYFVTFNHLVGMKSSKCFECKELNDFLPILMEGRPEMPYEDVFDAFMAEFTKICSQASSFPRPLVRSLVEMKIHNNFEQHQQFKRRTHVVVNQDYLE